MFINRRPYKQTEVQSENRMVLSNIKEQIIDKIATWLYLENIRLSKRCLTQMSTYYMNPFTCSICMKQAKPINGRKKITTVVAWD